MSEPAVSERLRAERRRFHNATSLVADKDGAPPVTSNGDCARFRFKIRQLHEEDIKQYLNSQSSTARRKVIICDNLPKVAMRVPRPSVLKNGSNAFCLCAGSWNEEILIRSSSSVSSMYEQCIRISKECQSRFANTVKRDHLNCTMIVQLGAI
jgi:hypothetical protein